MTDMKHLRRQAESYQAAYPPGTCILLLHMGNDPCPIEDNVRGTIMAMDDMGTLHCHFDNGRSLGVIPGEDSFRKLTDAELAEKQTGELDVDNTPVMGM